MAAPTHDFDLLDEWALLPDSQLASIASNESYATLKRLLHLLRDGSTSDQLITEDNFVPLVRELRQLKHEGSRSLGETILRAVKR